METRSVTDMILCLLLWYIGSRTIKQYEMLGLAWLHVEIQTMSALDFSWDGSKKLLSNGLQPYSLIRHRNRNMDVVDTYVLSMHR